jgi:hypothetical protein
MVIVPYKITLSAPFVKKKTSLNHLRHQTDLPDKGISGSFEMVLEYPLTRGHCSFIVDKGPKKIGEI